MDLTGGFLEVVSIHPQIILTLAVMSAIVIIGWANFINGKTNSSNKRKKLKVLVLSAITTFVCTPYCPAVITGIYFIFGLIVSISTIAYDVILKGIPNLIEKMMTKVGDK